MNSNKKIPKDRNNIQAIWLIFILFFIIEVFSLIWCRIELRKTGYEISENIKKNKILKENEEKLKIEFASLKSPERITVISINKLGLVMPEQEQMMRIP